MKDTFWSDMLKSFLLNLLSVPVWALSFIVVPVALLFTSQKDTHLPSWAAWWDDPLYGVNGDPYWALPEHSNGQQTKYIWRLRWLFRNSLGGWSNDVVGFKTNDIVSIEYSGDPNTSNRPVPKSGVLHIEVTLKDGSKRFCWYVIHQWGSSKKCFRFYFGWKLKDVLDTWLSSKTFPKDDTGTQVFSPNPLMYFGPN